MKAQSRNHTSSQSYTGTRKAEKKASVFTAFPSPFHHAVTSRRDKKSIRLRREMHEEHCYAGTRKKNENGEIVIDWPHARFHANALKGKSIADFRLFPRPKDLGYLNAAMA